MSAKVWPQAAATAIRLNVVDCVPTSAGGDPAVPAAHHSHALRQGDIRCEGLLWARVCNPQGERSYCALANLPATPPCIRSSAKPDHCPSSHAVSQFDPQLSSSAQPECRLPVLAALAAIPAATRQQPGIRPTIQCCRFSNVSSDTAYPQGDIVAASLALSHRLPYLSSNLNP